MKTIVTQRPIIGVSQRSEALVDARRMRDAIAKVLSLLEEIDDLAVDEPDQTVFEEVAQLFEDLADFAMRGAVFSRRLTPAIPLSSLISIEIAQ